MTFDSGITYEKLLSIVKTLVVEGKIDGASDSIKDVSYKIILHILASMDIKKSRYTNDVKNVLDSSEKKAEEKPKKVSPEKKEKPKKVSSEKKTEEKPKKKSSEKVLKKKASPEKKASEESEDAIDYSARNKEIRAKGTKAPVKVVKSAAKSSEGEKKSRFTEDGEIFLSIEEPKIELKVYSEKCMVLLGLPKDDVETRESLKVEGAKWNANLACGKGWIFAFGKNKKEKIEKIKGIITDKYSE